MTSHYQVDITQADDPDADEMMFLTSEELVEKFPWTRDLIKADPEFSASIIINLTRIFIYPTYWPSQPEEAE